MASAKIMICSGTGGLRIELKKLLEKNFYTIVGESVKNSDVVKNYKINRPDVVVMDLILEDGDCTPLIKQIIDGDSKAKIIAISATPNKQTIYNAITSGAKHFLPKPVDMNKLIDVIRTLLG